ncbi:MAG: hypothetical protein ACXW5U_07455 [Thermoanaerobaculia bacterium]
MPDAVKRQALRWTAIVVALALGLSGSCTSQRRIGIDEVLEALTDADRKIDNYCSWERSFTYDRNGRLKEGDIRSFHFYAKPDQSLLCVYGPSASCEIYYEAGTLVKTRKDGTTRQQTIPDSFFLRDWRSMMLLHGSRSDAPVARGNTASPMQFEFATGDPQKAPRREDGIYEIQITRPDDERAVLRVNVLLGVVLEKSVYRLPGEILTAREAHSDFVPLAGSYLPGKTVYEYGQKSVVIYWSDYRANLPVDFGRIDVDESTCRRLTALAGPVQAEPVPPLPAASGAVASSGPAPDK